MAGAAISAAGKPCAAQENSMRIPMCPHDDTDSGPLSTGRYLCVSGESSLTKAQSGV